MSTSITTVIFDVGGVFTDSPFAAVSAHATQLGIAETEMHDIVFGGYGNDADHPWHRVERGEITLEAAREGVLELSRAQGLEVDIWDVFLAMSENRGGLRHELVDHVRELRGSGLRTGIITNNIVEFREHWRAMVQADELFDFVIDSCEVGVRKPDPAIYALALAAGTADASEALFLDDYPANVAAAESLGITSILVDGNARQTIDDIRSALTER